MTGSETNKDAISDFSRWVEQFLSANPVTNLAVGEALAWKRREAMLALIESDPENALKQAVPYEWRLALPNNITRHFEQWVDGRGDLTVAVATDFDRASTKTFRETTVAGKQFKAFVYGRRSSQVSQTQIPLHGITLGGKMAVSTEAIRLLSLKEAAALEKERGQTADVICGVSSQPSNYRQKQVAADVGGEIKYFCEPEHAQLVNQRLLLAASGGANSGYGSLATANNNAWTHGRKNVLYMRVNFPDDLTEPISEAAAYNVMDSVNDFYTTGSYDVTALAPTVTPLMTLPETKNWYSTAGPGALMSAAREVARRNGFETGNYDLDIAAFTSVPDYDFGGLGAVHGKGTWLQSMGAGVTAHELGHNYGLWHANLWDTTNTSTIGTGTNLEYGNVFDTMGRASAGNYQFNAMHKNILDWLPDPAIQTLTNGGVCRIYPYDAPTRQDGRFYAAKVVKDYGRDYWIEFRQNFSAANPSLQNGVQLNWSPWEKSNGGTQLIDTTPDTATLNDSALVIGRTFSDALAGVHITPIARGLTGTDPWIEVRVTTGNPTPNWPPWLSVEVDPTNAAPGTLVHFHATAFDLDGDTLAYAWTFDDGTFSTNNQPWTFKSWAQPGEHVVRCVVSDMKGGSASANVIATIGAPTGFRITGVVLDANDDPIEGVRVGDTNGVFVYTDSDGGYGLPGLSGDFDLQAYKYGFTFTNLTWQSPLSVTSNLPHIDFLATALPTVRVEAGTNSVPETGGSTYFKFTRTGEITNDLMVKVYVANATEDATLGTDFTLSPPLLVSGSNTFTIPAGTQSVTLTFQTVADTQTEVDEVATVYILDDPAYFVALSGTAAIKILDDDLAAQPTVSIVTITPTVPENGMDRGTFLLSRAGNVQNPLTVFYSVGGTAVGGTDYGSLPGVAIIPAGAPSMLIQFKTLDDKLVEPDETVSITLTTNAAYAIDTSSAQLSIMDDDVLTVTIFPTGANPSENGGTGNFTVKRDGDLSSAVVVYYTTNGTATSGLDYSPLSGFVTIPPGAASADFSFTALDDALLEGDESVIVTLVTNSAYSVGSPGTAKLFIRDDELVSVSVTAPDDTASEPGDNTGSFRISRGAVINGDLTVNLAINGTAISGSDYVPLDNPVIIPDGASSVTLDLIAFDDLHKEPDESVIVTILPSTNYNIAIGQAEATIEDDDANNVPAVGFSFATSSADESKSPGIGVSLSATSSVPITVDYVVIGGTASPGDYSLPPPPLTFQPGERALSLPLTIVNDTSNEPNETIRIALFNPIAATLDGIKIHTYTIINDDSSAVNVTATVTNATETGTAGNFRITRSGATNAALLVNFEITGTASAPSDYANLGTSVTIPAGATFVDLPVTPVNDLTVEPVETVKLTLLTAPGSRIVAPNVATITITDNDPDTLPNVSVTSTNQPYAVEGGSIGAFVFTRSGATTGALTIPLTISGTATSGADYAALSNSITFSIGQSSTTLFVAPVNDSNIEGEETVIVALTAGETYRVAFPSAATVTIQDNDQRVWLDASDFAAAEPGNEDSGDFTFTRFGTTNTPVQVFFTITGSASNGGDYVTISNSFVIPAGSLTAKLPIIPLDDLLVEGPETVTITLQPNAAYTLGAPTTATVTIDDDEPMVRLVANTTTLIEGQKAPGILTVQRGGNPDYEFTARLSIGGTATYGMDYPAFQTNIFFNCGVTAIDLYISPTNELAVESTETLTAALVPNPAYTILSPSNALLTITDAGTNRTPVVKFLSPKSDLVYLLGTNANLILEALVTDDSDTNNPVTLTWTNVSGPNTFYFGNSTNQFTNTASFTNGGVYVLRLIADDGRLSSYADVTVMVDTLGRLSTNLLHWKFDEASGASVLDSSGNGHTGTVIGPVNRVTNGIAGGALNLTGTNNFVSELVDSALLNGRKQFSLSFWVKPATNNSALGLFTADASGTNSTWTLSTRPTASCGAATNVIEATFKTARTTAKHISASNATTNNWQHIALTWSNGLTPTLFINGAPDQPGKQWVALKGFITNSPQFIFGTGAADVANTWRGLVDEVRVFPRALPAAEVGGLVATNYGAVVNVPTNFTCPIFTIVTLPGTVTDDTRPNPPGFVMNLWTQVDGPAPVVITNASSTNNTLWFDQAGEYVFRLIADDGQVKTYADLPVTVTEPTQVNAIATDPDATELGPDPAEITFTRVGDTNFNLTVLLALSGTASNGADFPPLQFTNSITFPAGVDSLSFALTPFLDHRTEGDEQFICTIVSNIAYSIGSSPAIVTIHDSPYGVWNIANFTLEELTLPNLSGEDADFDHDHRFNFVEYASNTNPKLGETNAPLISTIESTNGTHITFTYKRRLEPTDVAYLPVVSNDLIVWHSGTNYIQELSATDDGNNLTETVRAKLVAPWPNGVNQFITVRVWLRTTGP